MKLTSFMKKEFENSRKICEHDLNQRKNDENFRILHNIDDRFQYENIKIRNKNNIVV
jgi:hypothetical protein